MINIMIKILSLLNRNYFFQNLMYVRNHEHLKSSEAFTFFCMSSNLVPILLLDNLVKMTLQ